MKSVSPEGFTAIAKMRSCRQWIRDAGHSEKEAIEEGGIYKSVKKESC
jgi:hypothetical protein